MTCPNCKMPDPAALDDVQLRQRIELTTLYLESLRFELRQRYNLDDDDDAAAASLPPVVRSFTYVPDLDTLPPDEDGDAQRGLSTNRGRMLTRLERLDPDERRLEESVLSRPDRFDPQ